MAKDNKDPKKGHGGKGKLKNPDKVFKKEAVRAARMQFRPQFQDINRELRAEKRAAKKIQPYFEEYQTILKNSGNSAQQGYNQAAQSVQDRSDQATAIDIQATQQFQDSANKAAGISGGVGDTSASNEALMAALHRRADADQAAASLKALGTSQQATFDQLRAVGQGAKIDAKKDIRLEIKDTKRDKRQLKGARGDAKAQYIIDARNAAKDFALKQQALAQAGENNQLDYQASLNSAKTSARNNKRSTATTRRGQDMTAEQRAADRAARERAAEKDDKESGTPKFSASVKRTAQKDLRKARVEVRQAMAATNGPKGHQLVDAVSGEANLDPLMVRVAIEMEANGRVSVANARAFRKNYGVKLPTGKKVPGTTWRVNG